jgi:hypothetical protein
MFILSGQTIRMAITLLACRNTAVGYRFVASTFKLRIQAGVL